jgi:hypothetical protein
MKLTYLLCILLLTGILHNPLQAQHEAYDAPVWKTELQKPSGDSNTFRGAFTHARFSGHVKSFSMATINQGDLSDYHALALGGGIRLQTAPYKNFQIVISGYFTHNLSSSDLIKKDPASGSYNRYEIGLFDIENTENEHDLDRLEELNLQYQNKNWHITLGKQILKTPFINPQDGRMRPTEVDGLWVNRKANPKLELNAGWLYKISPRSTVRWVSVSESIGIYPQGINTDGTPSGYKEELSSAGVFLAGLNYKSKNLSLQVFNQFTENIFNTLFTQIDYKKKQKNRVWGLSFQYTRQDAVADGGNKDLSKTYFTPGKRVNIFSSRLGVNQGNWQHSINYTRIGKSGRFLSPREWGREPFFTFLPRERNEGLGDVNAFVAKTTKTFPKLNLEANLGVGYFDLPDVTEYEHNKYGLPSYLQTNAQVSYVFRGWLQGLQSSLLYVYKSNRGETYGNAKFIINKVNMSNINLILDYQF